MWVGEHVQSTSHFKVSPGFYLLEGHFVSPLHTCAASELATSVSLAGTPSSLHWFCLGLSLECPSWLYHITLASGTIGPPWSPASGLSLPPPLNMDISHCSGSREPPPSPGKMQLPVFTARSALAELQLNHEEGGEAWDSPRRDFHCSCLKLSSFTNINFRKLFAFGRFPEH